MNVDRCPSCGGAVRAGAPWCQLCYASLTDPSSPVLVANDAIETSARAELTAALAGFTGGADTSLSAELLGSGSAGSESLADTYSDTLLAVDPLGLGPLSLEPLSSEPVEPPMPVGWPCGLCQTVNAFTLDMCSTCGAMFLPASQPSLELPLLGDLSRMGKGRRMVIAALAAVLFTAFFVFVGALAGQLL